MADMTGSRREPRKGAVTYLLRVGVAAYLVLLVAWPLALVVKNTFDHGTEALDAIFSDPDVRHALRLSAYAAILATVLNTVFGVAVSLLLVRTRFPGKRALSALIDLPLAVSPVVVGLALVLVYSPRDGWFGPGLDSAGVHVIFAVPGIVMATAFVSLPLVVREVVPVLREIGTEQEQAARTLGAGPWQTFRRVTLPSIKWAIVYGVVLTFARSLGEFGAVKVVSGNVLGQTRTATLAVEERYDNFDAQGAYAISFLLAATSVVCLVVVFILRARSHRALGASPSPSKEQS